LGTIAGAVVSAYLVGRIGMRPMALAGLFVLSEVSLTFGFGSEF